MSEFDDDNVTDFVEMSEATDEHAVVNEDKVEDEDYIFDGSESNELITLLGKPFFLGQIQQDDVDRYLQVLFSLGVNTASGTTEMLFPLPTQIIRRAVEDGIVTDDDIVEVIKFNSFTTVLFLLIIINAG
jgi:hypothetical protein